jgi:hypothetical protein
MWYQIIQNCRRLTKTILPRPKSPATTLVVLVGLSGVIGLAILAGSFGSRNGSGQHYDPSLYGAAADADSQDVTSSDITESVSVLPEDSSRSRNLSSSTKDVQYKPSAVVISLPPADASTELVANILDRRSGASGNGSSGNGSIGAPAGNPSGDGAGVFAGQGGTSIFAGAPQITSSAAGSPVVTANPPQTGASPAVASPQIASTMPTSPSSPQQNAVPQSGPNSERTARWRDRRADRQFSSGHTAQSTPGATGSPAASSAATAANPGASPPSLAAVPGQTQQNPLMPQSSGPNSPDLLACSYPNCGKQWTYFDPLVAVGYNYQLLPNGTSVGVTDIRVSTKIGNGQYQLYLQTINGIWIDVAAIDANPNGITADDFDVVAFLETLDQQQDQEFGITDAADGLTEFSIRGIDPSADLDPTDPTAFISGLQFSDTFDGDVLITPLELDTSTGSDPTGASFLEAIPEPPALPLFGLSLVLTFLTRRQAARVSPAAPWRS